MAYIEKEKAVAYFESHRRIGLHKDDIVAYLSNMPTADVVEVVRCKDCRYYSRPYGACYRNISPFIAAENDFCSYGERRTTDNDL